MGAPNVDNAIKAEKTGVDALIAEGSESGGIQNARETDTPPIDRGQIRVRVVRTPLADKMASGPMDETFALSPNRLEEARVKGNLEANTLPSGQIPGMLQEVKPVREIIEEVVGS